MKNSILKLIALLMFATVALQSCSVEYREKRRHERDERRQHDHDHDHDHDYRDHNYRNY